MSKLNIDQKTIKGLFADKKTDFLIPDYQRPYAWGEIECQTLWDDIFTFAIPEDDATKFRQDEEYFLGPIVTFKNGSGKQEIIDGQQRLTTLMLLLRAFYERSGMMQDKGTKSMRKMIEQCVWKTNEFDEPNKDALKIDSEVATDDDKQEFLDILKKGVAPNDFKSRYADNYRFFQKKIDDFLANYPTFFPYLPIRILGNCILLPIEAENQDTALRIFSTLNDRGKPLSDADIFKAEFYKYYSQNGKKEDFIERWRELERLSSLTFNSSKDSPLDELFTLYMYFLRAKQGNTNTTTEALRKFYEKDTYKALKNETTLDELEILIRFWYDVKNQDPEKFSDSVLKLLFVLNYAPNGMWYYFVSVYFMHNKLSDGSLEESAFLKFLERTIGFIWAYALTNPGVNALRTPIYREMVNLVNGKEVTFSDFKFEKENLKSIIKSYSFLNQRQITRSMITWWTYQNNQQPLLSLESKFDIEHIYARNRVKNEPLKDGRNAELLGNKSLLEQRINIRASDYRFADKAKYYKGLQQGKEKTNISELLAIANKKNDFTENDILNRNEEIIKGFIAYLDQNKLLK
ncbi:hypothetical protein IX335_000381 [Porphyromonas levii]|uniref:DUF262 domain-containing protein n=1 Tax=Porphyromonas levii TaxID=28114 RepID=UPI001BABBD79|nr:DUF262 domain-containing protein [Porphyromonas levii]MBR8763179.1 hypothetical protein [Porphyromonas levii]